LQANNCKQKILQSQKLFHKALDQAKCAFEKGNCDGAIAWAQIAAHLAFVRHPGFYASPALENLLLEIARKTRELQPLNNSFFMLKPKHDSGRMRFLHVITESYGSGGHSAFIARWIKNADGNSIHSVVSTARNHNLPQELKLAIDESGGFYCSLAAVSESPIERALFLRKLASTWADIIVLFIHPFDPIPTVAFGVEGGPPVIFCNHADHAFWLGVSVSDIFVDYHPMGRIISRKRRGISQSKILPIPLIRENTVAHDKAETRRKLGLKNNEVMMLTVARDEKFLPYESIDFFEVMVKLLKHNPTAKLFAVGPKQQTRWREAALTVDGRIRVLGPLDRSALNELFYATDIYVSSFPLGSGTALLEAGIHGIPITGLQFNELPYISGQDDVAFKQIPVHAPSISKLTAHLEHMINEPYKCRETAEKIKQNIANEHCPPGWNKYLDAVLQSLPSQHHVRTLINENNVLDYSDYFLANLNSEMAANELVEHSFARLIRVYSRYLSKTDSLKWQAKSLCGALPQLYSLDKAKEYLYNLKEFVKIGVLSK
jgi:hypothetical protein